MVGGVEGLCGWRWGFMVKLRVSLLTGRTLEQGRGKEYGKLSEEYWRDVAVCEMDPEDMRVLEVKEGDGVKIKTDFGSVVVRAKESERAPHPKVVFIPYGPWANLLVNPRTQSSGMPTLKGIPAEVELAPGAEPQTLPKLLKEHYGRK